MKKERRNDDMKEETMLSYCLKCNRVLKTTIGRITLLSKCVVSGEKKSKFIKEQGPSGLLIQFVIFNL